jgi:hypothetical protein
MIKFRSPIHIVKTADFNGFGTFSFSNDEEESVEVPYNYPVTIKVSDVTAVYPYIKVVPDQKKVTLSSDRMVVETHSGSSFVVYGREDEVKKKLGL